MLLVATPALLDPNFADTVVLLLDVDEDGALGVVLNRPTAVPVAEVLADWRDVVAEPEVLFHGGPVSTEGALAVALLRGPDDVPVGFRQVEGNLGLVDPNSTSGNNVPRFALDGMKIDPESFFSKVVYTGSANLERGDDLGRTFVIGPRERAFNATIGTATAARRLSASP